MIFKLACIIRLTTGNCRCYADFARVGGRQQVSLADECIDYATMLVNALFVEVIFNVKNPRTDACYRIYPRASKRRPRFLCEDYMEKYYRRFVSRSNNATDDFRCEC